MGDPGIAGATLVAVALRVVVFLEVFAFLDPAALRAGAFLATVFLAGVFLAAAFFPADFFAAAFLAGAFLDTDFFAAAFLVEDFLEEAFLVEAFLAGDFLADAEPFDGAFLEEPRADGLEAVFLDDFLAVFFFEAVDFFATRQGPLFANGSGGHPSAEGAPSTIR